MTDAELTRERRRRGHWLRLAREAAGVKQETAAEALGLAAGTTILAWEKGRRDPSASQMRALAQLYGVPVAMFADPLHTDEERVMDARAALARAAIDLAHQDLAAELEGSHDAQAQPSEPPRTRAG
jgi:transcriptional regulator with XRE-family HTH domain